MLAAVDGLFDAMHTYNAKCKQYFKINITNLLASDADSVGLSYGAFLWYGGKMLERTGFGADEFVWPCRACGSKNTPGRRSRCPDLALVRKLVANPRWDDGPYCNQCHERNHNFGSEKYPALFMLHKFPFGSTRHMPLHQVTRDGLTFMRNVSSSIDLSHKAALAALDTVASTRSIPIPTIADAAVTHALAVVHHVLQDASRKVRERGA